MSAVASVTKTPTFFTAKAEQVVVGHRVLKNLIEKTLKGRPYDVQLYPRSYFLEQGSHFFCRDTQVTLLDGSILIPYPLNDKFLKGPYRALLPDGSLHWGTYKYPGYSDGFHKNRVRTTIAYAQAHRLPYKRARTVIEGGNCILFKDPAGVSKAIIGSHSVLLSYFSLLHQQHFNKIGAVLDKLMETIKTPSDEAVRQGRNYSLYANYKLPRDRKLKELMDQKLDAGQRAILKAKIYQEFEKTFPGGLKRYERLQQAPVSADDRVKYKDSARDVEACFSAVLDVIAEDLQVERQNIAVVDQHFFHCDISTFVGPNGDEVFIHDEFTSREALERLINSGSVTGYELGSLESYKQASFTRSKRFNMDRTIQKLEAIGLKIRKVPGLFEAPGETTLNFMNGLLLGNLFLTNGSSNERLERIFKSAINLKAKTPIDVRFIDVEDRGHYADTNWGYFSEFGTEFRGFIHCLTTVHPTPMMPTSYILEDGQRLSKDIELRELEPLGHLRDLIYSFIDPYWTPSCSGSLVIMKLAAFEHADKA